MELQATEVKKYSLRRHLISRIVLQILVCTLLALPPLHVSAANNQTTPGTATATVVSKGFDIEAPYTDDDNTDNSLLIEWDEDGGDWGTLLGSQSLPNAASPYSYTIGPLTNGNSYQVRITYQDPDNADNIQILSGLTVYDPMTHSSLSTGSSAWSGDGGWGVSSGKYGEFTCETCHAKGSGNIKLVKTSINIAGLPGNGQTINFLSTANGMSDFGDDSVVRATSDKICEVCHSQNSFHNYDRSNNSANDHQNKTDCIICHRHNNGFKASCADCHGGGSSGSTGTNYWPDASNSNAENDTPGRHLAHIDALSQLKWGYDSTSLLNQSDHHIKQLDLCGYCHSDPGGGGHNDATTDTAFANAWNKAADDDGDFTAGSCSNINCHNSKATGAGTYGWTDAGTSQCSMCHANVTDNGNSSGETHLAHTGGGFGASIGCPTCHDSATNWATNSKPGNNHLNGSLQISGSASLTYSTANSYDGTQPLGSFFGGCSTNDCHNNGKNAAPRTPGYTWGTAIAGCAACHGDDAATLAEGHDAHLNAATGFGVTINCADCHGANAETQNSHIDQNVTLSGLTYSGDTAITGSSYGSCGTNACHENGAGGDPANTSYSWNDSGLADCTLCHSNAPSSGAHSTHIAATANGPHPSGSTDCGECHAANGNNSSMNGFASHIDGNVDFTGGVLLAAATDCNNCHGGATPAATAKDNWPTSTGVSCESCHGDYSPANSAADDTGVDAPIRSFNYDTAGHGQGGIAKACADCHTTTSSHISGSLGDANRIKDISSINFDTGGEENDWCNGCHASDMPIHYGNSKTAGGNSSDGLYCITCHDPHGSSSYDAMIRSSLQGRNVASFTDRSVRSQYYNDNDPLDNSGVCQVCHELENADQVKYYNRTDSPPAHYAGNCIGCHSHAGTEAFKPNGCSGCHGGGTTGFDTLNKNYWPDNADQTVDNAGSGDDSGLHTLHMTILAKRVYNETIGAEADNSILLDNTSNNGGVTSDTKQTALCAYCHTNPGSDTDHNNGDDAALMTIKHLSGAADDGSVDAFSPAASVTCSSVDCHNGKTTTTWYAADSGSVACTLCHTAGGSNSALLANPNSGLHTGSAPTISGQKHDDSVTGGCTACHDALPDYAANGSSHINGTVSNNGSLAGDRTAMGLFGTYQNSGSDNTGSCATSCHSGAGDNGTWARLWDSSIHYDPADGDYVECAGCHGGFAGDWTFGSAESTVDGSVSHDRNWDEDGNTAEVIGNHPDNTDKCKSCHGFGYAGVYDEANFGAHRDGKITFADEMGYNPSTHTCATYCHSSNIKHNLESSGWTTTGNTVDTPPLACTDCHAGAQASAGVNADSPHSTNTIFASKGVTYSCQDCHGGHSLGDTQVPNNATVGISYGTGGIDLSDPIGTATTEAEICWGCHDLHDVSEWGVNTDTNTASFPNFNFGSLSTSNWVGTWNGTTGTTAVWSSANFLYKQGNIQSTHSASASGVSGKDIVDNIRCSYCHDVHDTNVTTGDSYSGKPFLRGSWVGNPYLEDGAPRNDGTTDDANYSAYDVADSFGAVPRGATNYTAKGGYYIDQNSGYPTNDAAMDSPDKFAGLCRLCHEGTVGAPEEQGDGIWQAIEIDNLNKFGTPGDDWVGTNGHGAVIKGGGGSQAANIFTMADRMPSWQDYETAGGDGMDGGNPVMAYLNARIVDKGAYANAWGEGMRGKDSNAYQYQPYVDTGTRAYNYQYYNWGATVVVESGTSMSDSGIDANYHQFTCSKCHNPHASRLPRLMITNCLDTNHNTWDDTLVTASSDTNGVSAALSAINRSAEYSQMTSAQNCHRYSDPNDADSMGSGWNTVTPWQEF